jgi:hypothetical protein
VCWNKETGITCFDKNDDELNFFFNVDFSINDTIFKNICSRTVNVTKINPNSIIIDKIIRGDAGDNIQPIIIKKPQSQNIKRLYKVAVKDIDESLDVFNDDAVNTYIDYLCSLKNYQTRLNDRTVDEIKEHFKYNRSLVVLKLNNYPEHILEIFKKYKGYICNKDLSGVEYKLAAKTKELESILDTI